MIQNKIQIGNHRNSLNKRIFLLLFAVTFSIGMIILRLFNLQIMNYSYYQALASGQHDSERKIIPKRGEIYLSPKQNEPLLVATNITKDLVYAVPKEIPNPGEVASQLSGVLDISKKDILDKFEAGNQNYLPLKKQLPDEISEQIKQMKIPGIYLEPETIRFYPEQNLASHVLGFVGFKGDERVGQYGIEGKFEKSLAGVPGILGLEKDAAGRWITLAGRQFTPSYDGDSIYLTIDPVIQFKAQEVLRNAVSQHSATGGSVVIMDPKTGALLALAVYPDFNPNEYNKVESVGIYSNQALAGDYEPGSIFKPITMAAALDTDKVNPETTYEDTGVVEFPENLRIKNSDGQAYGIQNMAQVLEKSLNTGIVFVEQQLGHDNFKKYVKDFGLGQLTGLELPGEVLGNLDNLNKKGDIFFATASFGQGIAVTPIQLVAGYAAIANGGKLMKPYVVDRVVHADQTEEQFYPEEKSEVIKAKTAATLSAMLVNVVENGHGKRAGVKGYYIAGKTGTAQVPFKDRSGYDPDKNIGSFAGFGPVEDPAFVMLVRIDNPKDVKFAESTAAPAFGEIATFILNYLQIPPSRQ